MDSFLNQTYTKSDGYDVMNTNKANNACIEQIPYVMDFPKMHKPNTGDNNMSKFNSEAAKRGDAVQLKISGIWQDCYFVGASKSKYLILVEIDGIIYHKSHESSDLRMKPKKREMWVFPYHSDGVVYTSTPCETREEAEIVKRNFPKPAGEVQPILVEE